MLSSNKTRISDKQLIFKMFKNLIKDRLYNSLAQALLKILWTPHLIIRSFLSICVIISSCLSAYLVVKSFFNYFDYEVITVYRSISETSGRILFRSTQFGSIERKKTFHNFHVWFYFKSCLVLQNETGKFEFNFSKSCFVPWNKTGK